MKLDLLKNKEINLVTGYGENYISINKIKYQNDIILFPNSIFNLSEHKKQEIFDILLEKISSNTELLLIGNGLKNKVFDKELMQLPVKLNIGFEVMSTKAACRTYNLLVSEKRNIVCLLKVN